MSAWPPGRFGFRPADRARVDQADYRGANEPASVKVPLIGDGEFHDYILPVGENVRWKGRITTFRLDTCAHQGAKIEIEEIALVKR